jgi:hypothetical protein
MRQHGVRSLAVACSTFHHEAIVGAEPCRTTCRVPTFGPRMVCTKCGIVGADARPPNCRKAGPIHFSSRDYYCSDITASFFAFYRRDCGALPKVEYHQIGYADFAARHGNSIDRAFLFTSDGTNLSSRHTFSSITALSTTLWQITRLRVPSWKRGTADTK